MKIKLIVTGKTEDAYLNQGIEKYTARLKHYTAFSIITLPALKNTKALSPSQQLQLEAAALLKAISNTDTVILLDEGGAEYTSVQFAGKLSKLQVQGTGSLVFIIGGPYGFSPEIKQAYPQRLSLSKMTFSHQMIRLLFVEQLYRAYTIIHNQPYHHQ